MKNISIILLLILSKIIHGQDSTIVLTPISISGSRITIPFSEESRSISIISKEKIEQLSIKEIEDLLQLVPGIDIRKRGINGSQSDIFMRGGTFEQTLIMIDGFKIDDPQTGHHMMNLPVTIDDIERIEIIKGAASRIFGQNAFNGAINIITKSSKNEKLIGRISGGSYGSKSIGLSANIGVDNSSQGISFKHFESKGYRYNSDITNNFFTYNFNGNYKIGKIKFLASFSDRKFGANGFYASPKYIDQYEETQTGLIGVSHKKSLGNFLFKTRFYTRQNLDNYYFLRQKPEFYHNKHKNKKINLETGIVYISDFGITGIGIETSMVSLESNNLGDRNRIVFTGYLEHRFSIKSIKLDFTPGILYTNYNDIGSFFFPGIDIGYTPKRKWKIFSSFGQTFRVPTYTELFYTSPTTIGNTNLKVESSINGEIGIRYSRKIIGLSGTFYVRKSNDLIDYFKENENDKWRAINQNEILSKGIEFDLNFSPKITWIQYLKLGYSYIDNDIKTNYISKYSLNNLRHQFNLSLSFIEFDHFTQSIIYKYFDRVNYKSYSLMDLNISYKYGESNIFFQINNIFDEEYFETNLVEMPGRNFTFGIKQSILKK